MADLTYIPADALGEIRVGDAVEFLDRNLDVIGRGAVTGVGKTVVVTDCGRRWNREFGEYVARTSGGRIVESYPFPSIRKAS